MSAMYRILSPRQAHNSTNRVGEELHGSRNSSSSSSLLVVVVVVVVEVVVVYLSLQKNMTRP